MKVQRSITVPIRSISSWEDRWNQVDEGLIACWERGREVSQRDPELAIQARNGRLIPLNWKGGIAPTGGETVNTMTYKGHSARVDFDARDNIFVGHVLGVRDTISFHGETVKTLRTEFERAVKHYLAVCAKHGENPERSYSGKLMLRIPPEVHAAAAVAAEAAGESIKK